MATTFAEMTAEEFERLPESGGKFELNNGVLVEVEMPRAEHELVKIKLTMLLAKALSDTGFVVATEVMNRLGDRITRVPDVAIWRESDLAKMDPDRTIVGGPLIAVEIVSSETAQDLDEKIQQYFAAGTHAVWAIYPKTRAVVIARPDSITRLIVGDTLQGPEPLPSLKIEVASVFAMLPKQ
jgi:Uma2 family endonuclease